LDGPHVVAIIGWFSNRIVKKNGIMMVDFALDAERHQGKNATDAIYDACLLRFQAHHDDDDDGAARRLPLAFGHGIGSELRRPLASLWSVVFLGQPVLTLYTTPVIYIFSTIWHTDSPEILKRRRPRGPQSCRTVMNVSTPLSIGPFATTLLTIAIAMPGGIAFKVLRFLLCRKWIFRLFP